MVIVCYSKYIQVLVYICMDYMNGLYACFLFQEELHDEWCDKVTVLFCCTGSKYGFQLLPY